MNITERPLGEVLARNLSDFAPRRPDRPPWHQPSGRRVELASTGNLAVVNLEYADRVRLGNLAASSDYRDELEPTDWMAVGWAVAES